MGSLNELRYAKTTALAASLTIGAVLTNKTWRVYSIVGYNNGPDQYLQVHDASALPSDGAVPLAVFKIFAGANISLDMGTIGLQPCSTGLVICNSTTIGTKTIGAANCWLNVTYGYE